MNTLCGEETQDWTGHWTGNYNDTQDLAHMKIIIHEFPNGTIVSTLFLIGSIGSTILF